MIFINLTLIVDGHQASALVLEANLVPIPQNKTLSLQVHTLVSLMYTRDNDISCISIVSGRDKQNIQSEEEQIINTTVRSYQSTGTFPLTLVYLMCTLDLRQLYTVFCILSIWP